MNIIQYHIVTCVRSPPFTSEGWRVGATVSKFSFPVVVTKLSSCISICANKWKDDSSLSGSSETTLDCVCPCWLLLRWQFLLLQRDYAGLRDWKLQLHVDCCWRLWKALAYHEGYFCRRCTTYDSRTHSRDMQGWLKCSTCPFPILSAHCREVTGQCQL